MASSDLRLGLFLREGFHGKGFVLGSKLELRKHWEVLDWVEDLQDLYNHVCGHTKTVVNRHAITHPYAPCMRSLTCCQHSKALYQVTAYCATLYQMYSFSHTSKTPPDYPSPVPTDTSNFPLPPHAHFLPSPQTHHTSTVLPSHLHRHTTLAVLPSHLHRHTTLAVLPSHLQTHHTSSSPLPSPQTHHTSSSPPPISTDTPH